MLRSTMGHLRDVWNLRRKISRVSSTRQQRRTRGLWLEELERRHLLAAVTWDGEGGDFSWSNPLNWSNNLLPGSDDNVTIDIVGGATITHSSGDDSVKSLQSEEAIVVSGGSLKVNNDSAVNSGITISGGSLGASGLLTVGGNSTWTSGTISADGGLSNSGTFTISGTAARSLLGTVNNTGTITHTATGEVSFLGTTLNNLPGGVYDLLNGRLSNNTGINAVNNSGTFRMSAGTGTGIVGVPFNNTGGTIDVQAGTLRLTDGGNSTGGNFIVGAENQPVMGASKPVILREGNSTYQFHHSGAVERNWYGESAQDGDRAIDTKIICIRLVAAKDRSGVGD